MNFSELVLFVGLGAIVGFAGGLFAIGGPLIVIALLTAVFGFTQHDSQGTAMVMALARASVTLVIYARKKLLRVRAGLIMAVCSTGLLMLVPASTIGLVVYSSAGYVRWDKAIVLAPHGTRVAPAMKPRLLRRCFALVQAGAGLLLAAGH